MFKCNYQNKRITIMSIEEAALKSNEVKAAIQSYRPIGFQGDPSEILLESAGAIIRVPTNSNNPDFLANINIALKTWEITQKMKINEMRFPLVIFQTEKDEETKLQMLNVGIFQCIKEVPE